MISGINQQKAASELSLRNTAASKTQMQTQNTQLTQRAQTTKPSAAPPSAASRSAASLAAAAGLPLDKLSSSIVSFARFFSLPLKPQLLADIRRRALAPQISAESAKPAHHAQSAASQPAANSADSSAALKFREALSLAAAAAESKGIELSPKGLESYAEVVDPERQRRQDEERRGKKEKNEHGEKEFLKAGAITAGRLKESALENMEKDPVLEILNKLPGKNGRRWIALPIDFIQDGREYRASMRILLEDKSLHAVYMAVDIAAGEQFSMNSGQLTADGGQRSRYLFILESSGDKPARLSVFFISNLNQREFLAKNEKLLKCNLSELFKIPLERIAVKACEESFPYEAGSAELFPSVDEAV